MKIGDKVRFLNDVGGGIVTAFQSTQIALVTGDDGFEVPMPVNELVVVTTDEYNVAKPQKAPAGAANDAGTANAVLQPPLHPVVDDDDPVITFKPRPLERRGGDVANVQLAFVPTRLDQFSTAPLDVFLVNDSNYSLRFVLLAHDGDRCRLLHDGEAEANTKVWLERLSHEDLSRWARLTLQGLMVKSSKDFVPMPPLNVGLRVDSARFFRRHAFGPSPYFTTDALLLDAVTDGRPVRSVFVEPAELHDAITAHPAAAAKVAADALPPRTQAAKSSDAKSSDAGGPLEVDLHADALLPTLSGLSARDILDYQLKVFRETLDAHLRRRGTKIVFIHGKGEGVLRAALVKTLKSHYRSCRWQDASFQEYGYGATLVTIV